ncbi:MAG: Rne/Rng family ribonuclease [Elusimicrobia bacterium]|nr:Rne/Rng family ribonuclease [Elusimicrobiota bacterium]
MRQVSDNIILIEVDSDEKRAAQIYNSLVQELFIERQDSPSLIGNIYRGTVKTINSALEAAFVDIGIGRDCFLPFSEYPEKLTKEMDVVVQIKKDEIGGKPPRLSGFISISGRNLVFIAGKFTGGISKNIEGKTERIRLAKLREKIKRKFEGTWILRTHANGKSESQIYFEAKTIFQTWQKIQKEISKKKGTGLVFVLYDFTERVLKELVNSKTKKIIIEPKSEFKKAYNFIKHFIPEKKKTVFLNKNKKSLFELWGVENTIKTLTKPFQKLPSGGEIIIQATEALTTIDVNSGSFKKNLSSDEMAFIINKEAAREIMRQLRLRNIGGIIVCDFIDMKKTSDKKKLFDKIKFEASFDRAKIDILPPNKMGLVIISRQRISDNILEKITTPCDCCGGSGKHLSPKTVFIQVKRHLLKNREKFERNLPINIFVHPTVADLFDRKTIAILSKELKRDLRVRSDYKIRKEEFKIE